MASKMHAATCSRCGLTKPTGVTTEIFERWETEIGRRHTIERSIEKINADFDVSLLRNGVCKNCIDSQFVDPKKVKYNHAFAFAFQMVTHHSCDDDDYPSGAEMRAAIVKHLNSIEDSELLQNVDAPFDSFEED